MTKNVIRVLVADDHPIVRRGLSAEINLDVGMQVVGMARDGEEAVNLARSLRPDVILMDIVMPHMNGVEAITHIIQEDPQARILVLTSFSEDDKIYAAIKAGAMGYILKDRHPEDVLKAIRETYQGIPHLNPNIARRLFRELREQDEHTPQEVLTGRQMEILRYVAQGAPNRAIAEALGVQEATVRAHVSNILSKLDLTNRSQLVLYAVRKKLVDVDPSEPLSLDSEND
jgi:NarL family two-component system response regulator LiaR